MQIELPQVLWKEQYTGALLQAQICWHSSSSFLQEKETPTDMSSNTRHPSFILSGAGAGQSIFPGTHICWRWQHAEWLLSILLLHSVTHTAQETFLCLSSLLAKSKLQDHFHFLSLYRHTE